MAGHHRRRRSSTSSTRGTTSSGRSSTSSTKPTSCRSRSAWRASRASTTEPGVHPGGHHHDPGHPGDPVRASSSGVHAGHRRSPASRSSGVGSGSRSRSTPSIRTAPSTPGRGRAAGCSSARRVPGRRSSSRAAGPRRTPRSPAAIARGRATGRQPLALPRPDAAPERAGHQRGHRGWPRRRSATRPGSIRGRGSAARSATRRRRAAWSESARRSRATAHVGWHVDAEDWEPQRPRTASQERSSRAADARRRRVVLLHAWPTATPRRLPAMLERLATEGMTLVTHRRAGGRSAAVGSGMTAPSSGSMAATRRPTSRSSARMAGCSRRSGARRARTSASDSSRHPMSSSPWSREAARQAGLDGRRQSRRSVRSASPARTPRRRAATCPQPRQPGSDRAPHRPQRHLRRAARGDRSRLGHRSHRRLGHQRARVSVRPVAPSGSRGSGRSSGDWGGGYDLGMAALGAAARAGRTRPADRPRTGRAGRPRPVVGLDRQPSDPRRRGCRDEPSPPWRRSSSRPPPLATPWPRGIVDRLADEMAAFATASIRRLHVTRREVDVVLAGGLVRSRDRRLLDGVGERVRAVAPRARIVVVDAPPVLGASLLGLDEVAGGQAEPATAETLRRELADASDLPTITAGGLAPSRTSERFRTPVRFSPAGVDSDSCPRNGSSFAVRASTTSRTSRSSCRATGSSSSPGCQAAASPASPSTRSTPKASGATSRACRRTPASSWARWRSRTSTRSTGCRRPSPSTRRAPAATRARPSAR